MESGKTLHKMQCRNHSKNWRNLADTWASDTVTCDDPRVDLKELSAARTIWLKVLNILHILPFLTGFYLSPGSFRETAHSLSFYNTFSSARSAEQTIFSDEIVCIKVPLKLHSLKYGNLSRLCAFLDTDCFNRKKKKKKKWYLTSLSVAMEFCGYWENLPSTYAWSDRHYNENIWLNEMQKITQLVTFPLVRNIKAIPWIKLLVQFHLSAGAKQAVGWKKTDSAATTGTWPKIIWQRLGLGLAQCLGANYIHATALSGLSQMVITLCSYSDLASTSI